MHCITGSHSLSKAYPNIARVKPMRTNLFWFLVFVLALFSKCLVKPFLTAEKESSLTSFKDNHEANWGTFPLDDVSRLPHQTVPPQDFIFYCFVICVCCGAFLKYHSERSEFGKRVYTNYLEILTHCFVQSLGLANLPLIWLIMFIFRVCDSVRRYLESNFPQYLDSTWWFHHLNTLLLNTMPDS